MYFASREIGKLYETVPLIHNYALCYALGFATSPYFCRNQIPRYSEELTPLNKQGLYITPAMATTFTSVTNTWKYTRHESYRESQPQKQDTAINLPMIGRVKAIDVESKFRFYVLSESSVDIPHWIRLGKWMSKAEVIVASIWDTKPCSGKYECSILLNPLDLMGSEEHEIHSYSTFNVPPISLIKNVHAKGDYFQLDDVQLPAHLEFYFGG